MVRPFSVCLFVCLPVFTSIWALSVSLSVSPLSELCLSNWRQSFVRQSGLSLSLAVRVLLGLCDRSFCLSVRCSVLCPPPSLSVLLSSDNPSVTLSVHQLSVCLPVPPSVCLFVLPTVCLSVYLSVPNQSCRSLCLSVCLSVPAPLCPSACLMIYLSINSLLVRLYGRPFRLPVPLTAPRLISPSVGPSAELVSLSTGPSSSSSSSSSVFFVLPARPSLHPFPFYPTLGLTMHPSV